MPLLDRCRTFLLSLRTDAGRQAVRNLTGLMVCSGVSQLCGLGVVLLSARALGPAGMGVLLFALTLQSYLAMVGSAGVGPVLVREVGIDPEHTDRHVTAYLFLVGCATLLATACGFLVLFLAGPSAEERRLFLWVLAGNVAASFTFLALFDAQHRQARAALVAASADVLALLAFFTLARRGTLDMVAAGRLLALKWAATTAGQVLLYHFTVRRIRWEFRARTAWLFLRSGALILLSYLLFLIPMNAGVVLVRLLRSESETAVLGIASQVAMACLLFSWQVTRVAHPHITGPHGLNPGFVRRLALGFTTVTLALVAAAAAGGWLVITLLLPPPYRAALVPTSLLLTATWVVTVEGVLVVYLYRFRREGVVLIAHLVSATVFLSLGAWLIPVAGPTAAAACTLAAALSGTSVLVFRLSRLAASQPPARPALSDPVSPPGDLP